MARRRADVDQPVVRFGATDGPGTVVASWTTYVSGYPVGYFCRGQTAKTVTPIAGRAPDFRVRRSDIGLVTYVDYDGGVASDCSNATTEPFVFEARSGRRRGSVTLADVCAGGAPRTSGTVRNQAFELTTRFSSGVSLVASGRRPGVYTVRWVARLGWRTLAKVTVWNRVRRVAGRDIYEGADDFINTCINDSHRLWSRNGRLSCHLSGYYLRDTFFRKRPRR